MNSLKYESIDNLNIRSATSMGGFSETVLLLSPLPESIRAFEPIWDKLASRFNVIAIDLPGFGKSGGRKELLAPKAMATFVRKAIDHFGGGPMHVVGPDVGSSVALFIGQEDPGRIRSAVVGSAACVYPIESDGILTTMIMDPTNDELQKYSSRDIINGALANMSHYQLTDDLREDYLSSYDNGRFWDTMLFLKALPHELPGLRLKDIQTPVLIIWGRTDPLAILKNGEILHRELPNNQFHILESGHYAWEDTAEEYGDLLVKWIEGEYLKK